MKKIVTPCGEKHNLLDRKTTDRRTEVYVEKQIGGGFCQAKMIFSY